MTYKKTLEKEIRKSEDSMMDNATEMLECSQYELGYQDGIKFALNAYKNYDEMYQVVTAAAYWPFINYAGTMFFAWCILFGFVIAANRK